MSVLFFSNRTAFFHAFLRAISFFQTPFRLPQKEEKCQFFFSLIEWHFFNAFLRAMSFF